VASTEVAPSVADSPSAAVAGDLMKQVEAAAQPLKDIFSEIANKAGGPSGLTDLLSFFNKPKSSG
jgi:hypothetical protein